VDFFLKCYRDGKLLVDGLTPDQQETRRGKASTYLSRTKQQMIEDIHALTTLASALPEKHLIEVFTLERVDRFVSALLSSSQPRTSLENGKALDAKSLTRDRGKDLEALTKRQYEIAAILMDKGAAKCFERIDSNNIGLYNFIHTQMVNTILILSYAATQEYEANFDYRFDAMKYSRKEEQASTEQSKAPE
jgi:hypothetical protein